MHPNMVSLLAFSVNPFLIVMEWVPLGDLYKHLHTEALSRQLTWRLRMRVAMDVARGECICDVTKAFVCLCLLYTSV